MSKRCVGDSPIVMDYPYDSVRISRKRALDIVSVLCLAEDVYVVNWKRGRVGHAQVKVDGGEFIIEMRNWNLGTLLHEIAHINIRERFGFDCWWYHDARFKREQERLYHVYQSLADISGWRH